MKPEEYLKRNPWCSEMLLRALFGAEALGQAIAKQKIISTLSPWGPLLSLPNEDSASALNIYRLESARQFALLKWGPKVVLSGVSPAPMSTARYTSGNQIWDIFVDPGSITPEGIDFIRRPPMTVFSGDSYRLILASHSDRKPAIVQCVREKWSGPETWVGVSPISPFDPGATPDSIHSLERVIPNAPSLSIGKKVGELPADMQRLYAERVIKGGPGMVYRLAMVGDCPLLTLGEYALLEKDMSVIAAWQALEQDGWFVGEERKTLSPKAITLLGMVWGASAEDLLKYHPWPLTVQEGKLQYQVLATDWHAEHLRMVRQMSLSFIDSARRLPPDKAPGVQLISLVSSRLGGVAQVDIGNESGSKVIDSFLRVSIPQANGSNKEWDVLLGVDRGTFLLSQQEQRILQQQDVWQQTLGRLVTQVWVFADPVREERIMSSMKAASIPVWSTTLQRLRLTPDNPFWDNSAPSCFFFDSINGAAPWRPIWMKPGKSGVHSFLDYEV